MDFTASAPIYIQIADMIIENILSGKWPEGERIVSVREMAMQIEVNPNTVMRSYAYLQDIGIIFNKRGVGFFVTDGAAQAALKLKKEEFIRKEVPQFFKTMDLVHIEFKELKRLFEQIYREKKNETQ